MKYFMISMAVLIGGAAWLLYWIIFGLSSYGADHINWHSQAYFVVLALVLAPLTLVRLFFYVKTSIQKTKLLLVIAVTLNLLLITLTYFEFRRKNYDFIFTSDVLIWIFLWSIWQIATLITYILQVRAERKN